MNKRPGLSLVVAALAGALFGGGLIVAGMTQPARIIGFLDLLGDWQPSLLLVMGAAVVVYALMFRAISRRQHVPWFGAKLHLPTRRDIDARLVIGAAIFGVGWGLGGFCPGPAIVSAASGSTSALLFIAAMAAGMYAHHRLAR